MLELCLITNIGEKLDDNYLNFLTQVLEGGVSMIQLREKNLLFNEFKKRASILKDFLKSWNVPIIINDNPLLAKQIDADGVHLGKDDMNVKKAKEFLGPKKIIGMSIESYEDLEYANSIKNLTYVTASAVFPSTTKTNCRKIWGLSELEKLVSKSKHPMTAIGGINENNIAAVMKTGIKGVALISCLHDAISPKKVSENILKKIIK